MANNQAFKIKNGLSATRYLGTNGTETAGSEGYNLSSASYDSVSFSILSQDTTAVGLAIKSDGTALYMHGATNDTLYQYTLTTAWDLSTASYASKSVSTSAVNGNAAGVFFKPDGTSFWVTGSTNDSVYQYDMTTAWDVSTASYASKSFSVASQETVPQGLSFKSDGTKMYVLGSASDNVNQYSLSTAWDVSTASFDSVTFSVNSQTAGPVSLFFNSDGTSFFVCGNNSVFKYNLSTSWDVSTASYTGDSYDISPQSTASYDAVFSSDGSKMYVIGITNDTIYQYSTVAYTQTLDLSTGHTFSFTPSGATTVSFTNPPASGLAVGFAVEIIGDGSAITWPSSVKWHLATAPTATATKEVYTFITTDGGTTYYGKKAGENVV